MSTEPTNPLIEESRRQLQEDLAALQRNLESTFGWAPKSKGPVLLLLGAAAGFALAQAVKKLR
ncbi:MAG: hypothetical protein SX243_16115 [Acidobacteriota bacterium]|nr:hypothetical protein [Acidobacteriota bacterium]